MAYAVTAVPGTRQLVGEDWSLRAERIEMLQGNDWRSVIGVRRGLKLLVTWSDHGQELDVEAWAGEPEETDGVAVVGMEDGDTRLHRDLRHIGPYAQRGRPIPAYGGCWDRWCPLASYPAGRANGSSGPTPSG